MLGRAIAYSVALSRIPEPIAHAYDASAHALELGGRVIRSGAMLGRASAAFRTMRGRGHAPVVIAGDLFHGPGDRSAALASLSADYAALQADITAQAISPSDAAWALAEIVPAMSAWHEFWTRENASALGRWITDWSAFETWYERLVHMRAMARARGIHLNSSDPIPLPETIWQRGESGTGTNLEQWMVLAKWAVYAALGVLGFASLYAALHQTRHDLTKAVS